MESKYKDKQILEISKALDGKRNEASKINAKFTEASKVLEEKNRELKTMDKTVKVLSKKPK